MPAPFYLNIALLVRIVRATRPLADHAAVLRGCDVGKPRNLAKAVTVE